METLYPNGYGTQMVTLDQLKARIQPHMHPEAFRRHVAFIQSKGGKFGVGGAYRAPGQQPDGKPGFAPPGASFHEGQQFPSGLYYVAIDYVVVNPGLVHRAPKWSEVPRQGSVAALDYGIHMNVATEAWHGQPIELDGYLSWTLLGRPDLRMNYPIRGEVAPPMPPNGGTPVPLPAPAEPPPANPTPTLPEDDMQVRLLILSDSQAQFLAECDSQGQALAVYWAGPGSPAVDRAVAAHRAEAKRKNHQFEQQASVADVYNCVFHGDELPYGDALHTWVKTDFWRTVGLK